MIKNIIPKSKESNEMRGIKLLYIHKILSIPVTTTNYQTLTLHRIADYLGGRYFILMS